MSARKERMRTMRKKITWVVLWAVVLQGLLFPTGMRAQDDYDMYMREAGSAAVLYRGHQAYAYAIRFNGTYWWSKPEYRMGDVLYNGRQYRNVPLNIDAARQELVIQSANGVGNKVLASEFVDSFSIEGRRYLNLRRLAGPDAPDGYWQVLCDGEHKFLKQITNRLVQDMDGSKQMLIGDSDNYRTDVYNTFVQDVSYCYLAPDNTATPVRTKRQLLNLFKDRKREIRHRLNVLEAKGHLSLEQYGTEIIKLVESR